MNKWFGVGRGGLEGVRQAWSRGRVVGEGPALGRSGRGVVGGMV